MPLEISEHDEVPDWARRLLATALDGTPSRACNMPVEPAEDSPARPREATLQIRGTE